MELKNQVVSLELSQRLKELGVKQESLFYWTGLNGENFLMIVKDFEGESIPENRKDNFISAFTSSELGEMLPAYFATHKRDSAGDWICWDNNFNWLDEVARAENEVEAKGKMLEYLIVNGLIKL